MDKLILGVEIGGTKLQLGLGTPDGEILATRKAQVDPARGAEGIRAWLRDEIPAFIEAQGQAAGRPAAIGVGFGGPLNTPEGRVLRSVQIEGWADFPIRDWFEETFSYPAVVVNDSNAAAWGEYVRGFGRGSQHFFYTNLGSGVGGGFVFHGRLYDGQGLGAGEIGHTFVPDWTSPEPGAGEELERLCSGWAIEARLRTPGYIPGDSVLFEKYTADPGSLTARDLGEAAHAGDPFALSELDRVVGSMGIALANVLCLTGVERIAIGGGVAKIGAPLIDRIRARTAARAFITSQGRYEIAACKLGEEIVLVGAILLAGEKLDKRSH